MRRNPALIVQCASTADVVVAVGFGREQDLIVSVRCGALSTPGYSTCDGGVVIDLRPMNRVEVDPDARTARVQGGSVWAELDAAAQKHGLEVTGGRVSDTGVGGLALGSGSGWLERMYGVTCESLLSAEVVTADGKVVRASADENPELFWGLRGGGGNFGVVTEFEFRLHPVGPIITGGMLLYPRARANEVLRFYRDYIAQAPDEVGGGAALITAPPEDFIPEQLRGQAALGIVFCYVGSIEDAKRPCVRCGRRPLQPSTSSSRCPTPRCSRCWMPGIRTACASTSRSTGSRTFPTRESTSSSRRRSGCRLRSASSSFFCLAMWMDPSENERNIAWARGFAEAMRPYGVGTSYPSFIEPDEGIARLRASFGPEKYERLVALKRQWDPENVFRLNQNIEPGD